jgi:hypothetical protein
MVNAHLSCSSSGSNVYLIGDSTFNHVGQGIHTLLAHGDSPLLPVFFTSASTALQQEIHGLSSTLRDHFPRFSSVQDLAALARLGTLHPALHKALVCIYHLGVFIRCVFPTQLTGQVTGILTPPAATVVSPTISLIPKRTLALWDSARGLWLPSPSAVAGTRSTFSPSGLSQSASRFVQHSALARLLQPLNQDLLRHGLLPSPAWTRAK